MSRLKMGDLKERNPSLYTPTGAVSVFPCAGNLHSFVPIREIDSSFVHDREHIPWANKSGPSIIQTPSDKILEMPTRISE